MLLIVAACGSLAGLPTWGKEHKGDAVVFAPRGGVFASNVVVTLSTTAKEAVIRYTLDGTEPGESAPLYAAPLTCDRTTLMRARVFPKGPDGSPSGPAGGEIYTVLDEDVAGFHSNLPLVIVNSFGAALTREKKIEGAMQVVDGGEERTRLAGAAEFSGRCLVNVRGRASLRYPKNSFTVKLIDGEGDPESVSLLGMPAESDWVLYAPYPDKTLMRDVLAYELDAQMGHWAPRTRFVEVFVNRAGAKLRRADYAGVYVFEERIKRDSQRVDLAKLKPEDDAEPRITGGYIFKKDHTDPAGFAMGGEGYGAGVIMQNMRAGYPTGPGGFPADAKGFLPPSRTTSRSSSSSSSSSRRTASGPVTNHYGFAASLAPPAAGRLLIEDDDEDVAPGKKREEGFRTSRTNEFFLVEPDPDEATPVQKAWLLRHLNQFEAALYGENFRDEAKGYRAFIDVDSFIDYHLIVETTKNADGFRFSVFFQKDRGGKIRANPIWDWNLSFGNCNGKQCWLPEHWLWPQLDDRECSWYRRLFDDPDFGQRYVDRWAQLRTNVFATKRVLARIDVIAAQLQEAQKRNFEKWPIIGRPINPQYLYGATYEEEVGNMRKFTEMRLDWVEKQFVAGPQIGVMADGAGRKAGLTAPAGQIYFTLDGSDPRSSGGEPAKQAQLFAAPLPLPAGSRLAARVRHESRWSAPAVWRE